MKITKNPRANNFKHILYLQASFVMTGFFSALFVRREKLLNVFDDSSEFSFGYNVHGYFDLTVNLFPKLTAQKTMTIKKLKNFPGKTFKNISHFMTDHPSKFKPT